MRYPTLILIAMTAFVNNAATAQQSASRPVVIELFTSQGCSSCPPADALLGELAKEPDVLALAYHVDYWDDLGWRDRFAIPAAVQRQRRYVSVLGLSSPFTPQSVVDGRISLVGSDRGQLLKAIGVSREALPIKLNITNDELIVELDKQPNRTRYNVDAIAYLPQATSAIGRGENAGHTLKEFNIVRSVRRLGTWDGQASRFSLPLSSLPADASRVAVLLQTPEQGAIGGAASVALR